MINQYNAYRFGKERKKKQTDESTESNLLGFIFHICIDSLPADLFSLGRKQMKNAI